jgi:quercetin dioxygenase-like cupin family protein
MLTYFEMFGGGSPMHLTKSVDYAIVMEGELEMHLDDGSTTVLRHGSHLAPDFRGLIV